MKFGRSIIIVPILAVIALAGCAQVAGTSKPAPDFTLENMSGEKVSLSQHRGKVVLIGFWAVG